MGAPCGCDVIRTKPLSQLQRSTQPQPLARSPSVDPGLEMMSSESWSTDAPARSARAAARSPRRSRRRARSLWGAFCHAAGRDGQTAHRSGNRSSPASRALDPRDIARMQSPPRDYVPPLARPRWSRGAGAPPSADSAVSTRGRTSVTIPRGPRDEHERVRLTGLHILARIIARRALAHPGPGAGRLPREGHTAPRSGPPLPVSERARGVDSA